MPHSSPSRDAKSPEAKPLQAVPPRCRGKIAAATDSQLHHHPLRRDFTPSTPPLFHLRYPPKSTSALVANVFARLSTQNNLFAPWWAENRRFLHCGQVAKIATAGFAVLMPQASHPPSLQPHFTSHVYTWSGQKCQAKKVEYSARASHHPRRPNR